MCIRLRSEKTTFFEMSLRTKKKLEKNKKRKILVRYQYLREQNNRLLSVPSTIIYNYLRYTYLFDDIYIFIKMFE